MKKTTLLAIVLIVGAMITFYSCKKDNSKIPDATSESKTISITDSIQIKDNRLVFASVNTYENFIENSGSSTTNTNRIGQSLKTSQDTLIDNDFLTSILNDKNIIQIGQKAYKLDFANELCYVLSDLTADNMKILEKSDTISGKLKVYSFDDEVLYLDEEANSDSKNNRRCHDSGASRKHKTNGPNGKGYPVFDNLYVRGADGQDSGYFKLKPQAKNVYQKAAIYFALEAKFKYEYKPHFLQGGNPFYKQAKTIIEATYTYKLQPKCKPEESATYTESVTCDHKTSTGRVYQSSRGLHKYKLSSEFDYVISGCYQNLAGVGTAIPDDISDGY